MKYKFIVSGSAVVGNCCADINEKAYELGREIVRNNGICITGATTGVPHEAARGAKDEGGISIGISPAATYASHVKSYRLPTDYFDFIIYTGFHYSGRNLILTKAADAVIVACGGYGTLNEFTIAFEDQKPMGVLDGSWETADLFKEVVEKSYRGPGKIVYDSDPKRLVEKVIELIRKEKVIEI